MTMSPEDGSLLAELKALRKRVDQLERADRMGMTSFREPGGLRFFDRDGGERLSVGRRRTGGEGDVAIQYWRDGTDVGTFIFGAQLIAGVLAAHGFSGFYGDGTNLFSLVDPVGATSTVFSVNYENGTRAFDVVGKGSARRVTVWSPAGDALVWVTEDGLARPRQSIHWTEGWFGASVDSGTFQTAAEAWITKTFSMCRLQYRVVRTGSPTVEVRLRDMLDDATVGGPWSHDVSGRFSEDISLPGDLNTSRRYELQARISDGSTSARVHVVRCEVGLPG